jgi:putative ABC transport system permease protein
MDAILRLAVRNLKEHKSKTIIIALFIVFGVAIVIFGNSFLESVNRGLEKDFRANYTGDVVISVNPPKGMIIDIFGVQATGFTADIPQVPALVDLDEVDEILAETKGIKNKTRLITAQVILAQDTEVDLTVFTENDDLGIMDLPMACLFAGENNSHWETFDNVNLSEGKFPEHGGNEIIVDSRVVKGYKKTYGKDLNIGDKVLVLGANTKGIIREAQVCGIFTPQNEYSAMFQSVYCTPEFARSFADLTYASSFKEELPDSVDLNLTGLSEEELFGDFDDEAFGDIIDDSSDILASSNMNFDEILGDTSLRDELNKTDDGSWQFILMKLENPRAYKKVVALLNKQFNEFGINAKAMTWKEAAFSYTSMLGGISFIFNLLIIILAVVVFIIIMNTMLVSVMERTSEIGTMRAIGAEKKFVKKLFYTETVLLTSISSVIGIVLSFVLMGIFNSFNIVITNEIAKMILGGGLLHCSPTIAIIITTFLVAVFGGIISNTYPVRSALKITPLKALSKE